MALTPRLAALCVAGALCAIAVSGSVATAGGDAAAKAALVKVAFNKTLHKSILVDARGHTLYLFASDSRNKPTCYNDSQYHCSKAWPPLRTTGAPHPGAGVKASLLGVAKRTDGASQVTYNGHPLYTNAGAAKFSLTADAKPDDVNGQAFLGIWFAVAPSGKQITH